MTEHYGAFAVVAASELTDTVGIFQQNKEFYV